MCQGFRLKGRNQREVHISHVVFTINGPGEISAWLYPIAHELKQSRPDINIRVCLLPCVFSSGAERAVLEGLTLIDAVCDTKESLGLTLRNKWPQGLSRDTADLVVHLGGEIALTTLLAKRLKTRAFAYVENRFSLQRFFDKVFFSGLHPLPDAPRWNEVPDIGDLMVDAATLRRQQARDMRGDKKMLGLFLGSREFMVVHSLPLFSAIVDDLAGQFPDHHWATPLSDFISPEFLRQHAPLDGDGPHFHDQDGERWIETRTGQRIDILSNREILARADYALTVPGTNTGEIAASGLPMLTVLPTQYAENAPLPGLAGHVQKIPFVGFQLKQYLLHAALNKLDYVALPNRRAGRMIAPELIGEVPQAAISQGLADLMTRDVTDMKRDLKAAMGKPGAARIMADAIIDHLDSRRTDAN